MSNPILLRELNVGDSFVCFDPLGNWPTDAPLVLRRKDTGGRPWECDQGFDCLGEVVGRHLLPKNRKVVLRERAAEVVVTYHPKAFSGPGLTGDELLSPEDERVIEQAGKDIARGMIERRDAEEYCRIACAGAADALLGKPWTGPMLPTIHATEVAYWPCRKKRRYLCKKDATTAMIGAMSRRKNRPRQLRTYACPHCNGWHLTSKPLRE